jgi:hypothetical protein
MIAPGRPKRESLSAQREGPVRRGQAAGANNERLARMRRGPLP